MLILVCTFYHLVLKALEMGLIVCVSDEETESRGSVTCPPAECASSRARDLNTGPFARLCLLSPSYGSLGGFRVGRRPGWKWGAGLQLLGLRRGETFLSEEAPASPTLTGAFEWRWSCALGSHSGITGPQNSQFSLFVAFSYSLGVLASIHGWVQ